MPEAGKYLRFKWCCYLIRKFSERYGSVWGLRKMTGNYESQRPGLCLGAACWPIFKVITNLWVSLSRRPSLSRALSPDPGSWFCICCSCAWLLDMAVWMEYVTRIAPFMSASSGSSVCRVCFKEAVLVSERCRCLWEFWKRWAGTSLLASFGLSQLIYKVGFYSTAYSYQR